MYAAEGNAVANPAEKLSPPFCKRKMGMPIAINCAEKALKKLNKAISLK